MHRRVLLVCLALSAATAVAANADTLVLRNGTRVEGEVVSVRNGVIEFEERRGFGRGRLARYDRQDVRRIEFDDGGFGSGFSDGGAGSTPGGGSLTDRPSGMRERQVQVASHIDWTDTGIDLRAGQTVYFEAQGRVRWVPGRQDTPEGESGSPNNPGRPMPNRPAAALVGKVGAGRDVFFIGGERGGIRIRTGGRLYLGVNDDVLTDNTGEFRVLVYY
jgi:hypothetical protein